MFYLAVGKLKLDYLPAGNSIDICPTFERKRQGQTFNYCLNEKLCNECCLRAASSPCQYLCPFCNHRAVTWHVSYGGMAQGSTASTRPEGIQVCPSRENKFPFFHTLIIRVYSLFLAQNTEHRIT